MVAAGAAEAEVVAKEVAMTATAVVVVTAIAAVVVVAGATEVVVAEAIKTEVMTSLAAVAAGVVIRPGEHLVEVLKTQEAPKKVVEASEPAEATALHLMAAQALTPHLSHTPTKMTLQASAEEAKVSEEAVVEVAHMLQANHHQAAKKLPLCMSLTSTQRRLTRNFSTLSSRKLKEHTEQDSYWTRKAPRRVLRSSSSTRLLTRRMQFNLARASKSVARSCSFRWPETERHSELTPATSSQHSSLITKVPIKNKMI